MTRQEFESIGWGNAFWGIRCESGYEPELTLFKTPEVYGEPDVFSWYLLEMGSEVSESYENVTLVSKVEKPDVRLRYA